MDVFSPALEIRNAGSPVDIFTPVPLNKRELVSPVDVFSPAFRKKKEQAVWETVSAQLLKIRRVGMSGGYFYSSSFK